MEYENLIKIFENGEKVFYKKHMKDNWNLVSSKEELFPIHNYIYKTEESNFTDKKEELIKFIILQSSSSDETLDIEDFYRKEGFNEALKLILSYVEENL